MLIGINTGLGDRQVGMRALAEIGPAAQFRGFESVWLPEHVVLFDRYESPYPFGRDGANPLASDVGFFDPFVALSYIAATTTTLRLGTSICIVPQRNPLYTAKQVADLDVLSEGRVEFGMGLGWAAEEDEALGVPWAGRGRRADEYLEVMKSLWVNDVSSYQGEAYRLPSCRMHPKPCQRPHPPVLVGGDGPAALRRAVRHGGWYGMNRGPDDLRAPLAELERLLEGAGRARNDFIVTCAPPVARRLTRGDLDRYAELGVDRLTVAVFPRDRDALLRALDRLAELASQYLGSAR